MRKPWLTVLLLVVITVGGAEGGEIHQVRIPAAARDSSTFEYRVLPTVVQAAALPDSVPVLEVTADEVMPHIIEMPFHRAHGQREAYLEQLRASRPYAEAGTIRVMVLDARDRSPIRYADVLALAKASARENGVHGLLFQSVHEKEGGMLWFDWMGVYRAEEAPEEFRGVK
ncbi:hypothetical protein KDK88_05625 [bacterium]|nr:hypothetical protein [bacterium]